MKIQFDVKNCDSDVTGHLNLEKLLTHIQEAGGDDSHNLGFGKDKVFDKGYLWVISRTAGRILRMPKYGESVEINTIAEPNRMFFYPRFTSLHSLEGELLLECDTIWAIIDSKTRKPVLPKTSGIIVESSEKAEKSLSIDSKMPSLETTSSLDRIVAFSDLDVNGHMNNTKYVAWANDILGSEYLKTRRLIDFRLAYHAEAKEGETMTQKYTKTDKEFYVLGCIGERKIYEIYLKFE